MYERFFFLSPTKLTYSPSASHGSRPRWHSTAANILSQLRPCLVFCHWSRLLDGIIKHIKIAPDWRGNHKICIHTWWTQCVFPFLSDPLICRHFSTQRGHSERRLGSENERGEKETTSTAELSKSWDSCPTSNHQSSARRLNGVTVERKPGWCIVSNSSLFLPPRRWADLLNIRGEWGLLCCFLCYLFVHLGESLAAREEMEAYQNPKCRIGECMTNMWEPGLLCHLLIKEYKSLVCLFISTKRKKKKKVIIIANATASVYLGQPLSVNGKRFGGFHFLMVFICILLLPKACPPLPHPSFVWKPLLHFSAAPAERSMYISIIKVPKR